MKMVIDLKTLDMNAFNKALGLIESLVKKRGFNYNRILFPTKTLIVDSGYELRISRAMLTITNPDVTIIRGINEILMPITKNLEIETKRLKNALAQNGRDMSEKYIQKRLGSKIEIQKGF